MARIELSNIGGGGGGGSTTLALTTTGTSGASVLTTVSGGYSLNIPVYQGALSLSTAGTSGASTLVGNTLTIPTYQGQISLTTTGTSGASTFVGNTLNIPTYQGAISLTTTGTSGAATLVGNTLNVPQYSTAPAGSTGQIQYNNAGAFGASANLAWDNSNVRLNIGAPSSPTAILNVRGGGTTSTTINTNLTNSSNTSLFTVLDNSFTGINNSTPTQLLNPSIQSSTSGGIMVSSSSIGTIGSFLEFGSGPHFVTHTDAVGVSTANFACVRLFFNANGLTMQTSPATAAGLTRTFTDRFIINQSGNATVGTGTNASRLHVIGANTTAGVGTFLVQDGAATPSTIYRIDNDGKITYRATNTAAGTTGAQTINRPSGTVNFAAGATALVVTNSLCTTASLVFAEVRTNDATAQIKNVVPAAGSFTINLSAAATAETSVGFFIIN